MGFTVLSISLLLLLSTMVWAARFELKDKYTLREDLHVSGVFADGPYLYIWYDNYRLLTKYYIDPTGKLRVSKVYGSDTPGEQDYMAAVVSAWADKNYVYVLDRGGRVFKFDKGTGELKFRGDSESYKPAGPAAIAAFENTIYVLDSEKGQVNVLKEYEANKYSYRSSISWTYLGIGDAIFNSPRGMCVYNGTLYIADTYNNRIAVFADESTYLKSYGRGSTSTLSRPQEIAVDDDYIYVVQGDRVSIEVLLREDGRILYSIGAPSYKFGQVSGISTSNGLLYVTDYKNNSLLVFFLNKTSLLGPEDVTPIYDGIYSKVNKVCDIFAVANSLNLQVIDRCSFYNKHLGNASDLISKGKYDEAYSTLKGIEPQLDGDLSFAGPLVSERLKNRSADLFDSTTALSKNLSGSLQYAANKILLDIKKVNRYIENEDYVNANILLKELEVRYASLSKVQGIGQEVENKRIENYKEQLENADALYSSIKEDLIRFKVPADTERIEYLLGTVGSDIDNFELDTAYAKLTELLEKLNDAQSQLQKKKAAFYAANTSITEADALLNSIRNSSISSSVNTTDAEELILRARKMLYDDPALAKQYADEALAKLKSETKSAEDTNYLTLVSVATVLFVILIIALLVLGVKQLFRKKPWQ